MMSELKCERVEIISFVTGFFFKVKVIIYMYIYEQIEGTVDGIRKEQKRNSVLEKKS